MIKSVLQFMLIISLVSSCLSPCKNSNCINGDCQEDICLCDNGYEGETCELESRQKFFGVYAGTSSCNGENPDYIEFLIDGHETQVTKIEIANTTAPGTALFTANLVDSLATTNYTVNILGTEYQDQVTFTFKKNNTMNYLLKRYSNDVLMDSCNGIFVKQ